MLCAEFARTARARRRVQVSLQMVAPLTPHERDVEFFFKLACAFGVALWAFVATEGTPRLDEKLVLLVVSPATALNIWHGQNGFFTAAILIGGLTMLDRRPILAGVLFGTLSIKPQLGVLLPLV